MAIIDSNPRLVIDGQLVPYKANSFKRLGGKSKGETNTSSLGGGITKKDISTDDSTNFDSITFELFNTEENRRIEEKWINLFNQGIGVVIQVGADVVLESMFYTGEREVSYEHNGTIKLTFEGGR